MANKKNINNINNEDYIYLFIIKDIKSTELIQKYFCDPFDNYIYYEKDKNNNNAKNIKNNKFNIILKIKDIDKDFAYIKIESKDDKKNCYIKWNIINYNNINTIKLENLKNKIKINLESKNNNFYKKIFLLILLEYLENKNYINLFKFLYEKIAEFYNHDSLYNDNITLLLNFLNKNIWYNIIKDYIEYTKNKELDNDNSMKILFITLNNMLINYIYEIENKYIKINSYKINIKNRLEDIPSNLNIQINKDFKRLGSIIFINGYNYIINVSHHNISNDFKTFIKKICIENDINDDNKINYLSKIIMDLCQQGSQALSSEIHATIFGPTSILKSYNTNMFFKVFSINKDNDDIIITAYLNNNFEICTIDDIKINKIKLGYFRNIEKYYIKINKQIEINESNMESNNYLYLNDDIFNYKDDIIQNYNDMMITLKNYYLILTDEIILKILNDNKNKNSTHKLNLIYQTYYKTYNFHYYNSIDRIFNYLIYKNVDKQNILLERIIYNCYTYDINNNFFINFFANKVYKPIIKNDILPIISGNKIKNEIIKSMEKDILIISYNEGFKNFDDFDVFSLLYKILIENPKIIVVCTQESPGVTTIKNSYQKILENYLENYKYILLTKLYYSGDFSFKKFNINDKNVRTYVYQRKDYNGVKNYYIQKSVKSGLSSVMEGTLNKGSLSLRLELEENNQKFNYIIVNSHLFSNKKALNEIAFSKRKDEFFNLIKEFDLPNYYKNGYNIFFCGDLNFKLLNPRLYKNEFDSNKISKTIINNYLNDNTNKFTQKYKNTNELIQILNNNSNKKSKELNIMNKDSFKSMIQNFKENIIKIGYDLTCKYKIEDNPNKNEKKKLEKGIINTNNYILKKNKLRYIPSMCDRILFASKNNLNIESKDFNMYLVPYKTDHKLLTLSFNFDYFNYFK